MPESEADNTPEAMKMRWEIRKLRLDVMLAWISLGFAATLFFGALLLFLYFFRDGFNAGISASDTVSFSLLSFSFGVTISIVLVVGTVTAFPIVRVLHWLLAWMRNVWRRWRRGATPANEAQLRPGSPMRQVWREGMKSYLLLGGVLFCLFVFGFIYVGSDARFFMVWMLALGFVPALLVFGTQVQAYPALPEVPRTLTLFDAWLQRQPLSIRQAVIASIITISFISLGIFFVQEISMQLQEISMQLIGYRKHDVSVRLSKEDFLVLTERATRAGYAINACQSLNPAMPVIDHIDVLWHKLGTTALIRYPALPLGAPAEEKRKAVRFEPLNASLTVISSVIERETCREFLNDTIFQAGQAGFAWGAEERLDEQLTLLESDPARWTIHIAVLDPVGPRQTVAQAQALKAYLMRRYRLASSAIVIETGRTDRKRVCDDADNARLCEKVNRRIEIRVGAVK